MKIFGSFLLLIFGFAIQGTAQSNKIPDFKSDKPLGERDFKFGLPRNFGSLTLDTSEVDSDIPFLPRSLSIDREIKLISPANYQSRMPIHALPDSDSLMPIKNFGDSVNYTILKKKF